ncbi:leucine-rich repeat domain-containing protein [Chryseobacterium sp. JUb7]|uniref:leucine-rich repeat domain-containing protein n=1 Tax=Chryseobacterium sp. JUb7 TaxID=2940599 RepID=UPI002169DE2A|nr:leucine-rich repeat domain-containing protein [Chryseobacterium sp. JUb7]MCS3530027.1 hypothetical protein [Chryseobacterium sp. JUb7]
MTTREKLKQYFKANKKPTQQEFEEWLDSYWHQAEDLIPQDSVNLIEKVIPYISGDVMYGYGLSITIPSNIRKINDQAFVYQQNSRYILEIKFSEGLEEIGTYAFFGQMAGKIKTPSTLKRIEEGAFSYLFFEEIILNEGLEYIGKDAFRTVINSISTLYIPNSVTFVGENAFLLSHLQSVSAPAGLDLSNSGIPASIITYR